MRVLLADGRGATLLHPTGKPPVVIDDESMAWLTPWQCGSLTLEPDDLERAALLADAMAAGYRFAGLPVPELQQARAGRVRSPAKTAAARVNGPKGGRPRKVE